MHEQVDRLFGVLSWLRQHRLDGVDNTHARMSHYETVPRAELFPSPPRVAPTSPPRTSSVFGVRSEMQVFPSAHVPLHPHEISRYFDSQAALHQFRVRTVRRRAGPVRRACIYLHPWMAEGTGWLDHGFAKLISQKLDSDVYSLEQVHHGLRQLPGSRFAGAHFFSADIARTFESLRQAVSDARSLANYLETLGTYDEVGIVGVSLGGTIATICACLNTNLAWCVPVVSHIDIADAVRHAPIAAHSRAQLRQFGVSLAELDRLNQALLSEWLRPAIDGERLFLIAGRRDICMRSRVVERQLERWPGVRCTWVDGGHITSLLKLGPHLAQARAHIDALPLRDRAASGAAPSAAVEDVPNSDSCEPTH